MAQRQKLHEELCAVLGSNQVYYQPPETVKLKYPCIVYELAKLHTRYADDTTYKLDKSYDVTFITRDVDSQIPEKISWTFPKCQHGRRFVSDNLYHDTFTIYY